MKWPLKLLCCLALITVAFASCIKLDLYEKQVAIPGQKWYYDNDPHFTFHIDDTTSLYNVLLVLRHTDLYQYNNIWLRVGLKSPADSFSFQNINIKLASDARGWDGTGMDDIYEVRKNISAAPFTFKKQGDYTFSVQQIMRENPLPYVLNVGIRVEKVSM